MPTVLDVVGIELPGNLQGASLLQADAETDPRPIHSEAYLGGDKIRDPRTQRATVSWAVVSPERLKLISVSDGRLELYDLKEDPAETRNLAAQRPKKFGELLRELEAWKERYPLTPPPQQPKNRFMLDRLRALGYVR